MTKLAHQKLEEAGQTIPDTLKVSTLCKLLSDLSYMKTPIEIVLTTPKYSNDFDETCTYLQSRVPPERRKGNNKKNITISQAHAALIGNSGNNNNGTNDNPTEEERVRFANELRRRRGNDNTTNSEISIPANEWPTTDNEQCAIDFLQSSDDLGYSPADRENTDPTAVDLSDETINNEALHASSPAMKAPFDEHVGSLLKIPYGEEVAVVEVLDRKRTPHIDGRLVEKHDNSPLDPRRYNVRMPNSEIREHTANLVAENLFAQCDEDGNYRILFDEIIDHKHDETAIPIGKDTYFDKR